MHRCKKLADASLESKQILQKLIVNAHCRKIDLAYALWKAIEFYANVKKVESFDNQLELLFVKVYLCRRKAAFDRAYKTGWNIDYPDRKKFDRFSRDTFYHLVDLIRAIGDVPVPIPYNPESQIIKSSMSIREILQSGTLYNDSLIKLLHKAV